jgi:hypothetical protein
VREEGCCSFFSLILQLPDFPPSHFLHASFGPLSQWAFFLIASYIYVAIFYLPLFDYFLLAWVPGQYHAVSEQQALASVMHGSSFSVPASPTYLFPHLPLLRI